MHRSVRVVLSDLDDTLFDHRRATRAALTHVRAYDRALAGWEIDELDRRHRQLLEASHIEVLSGRASIDGARVDRFRRLLADAAADRPAERAAEIAKTYRVAYEQAWHPVAGAVELLKAIKRAGRSVVVVTNNVAAEQRQKLDRCGLTPYVDALITSEEVGVTKPEAAIFRAGLEGAGATNAEAVMLGDSWLTDIKGARQAGLRAVWLNRFDEVSPDPSVPELRALEPVVDALNLILLRP